MVTHMCWAAPPPPLPSPAMQWNAWGNTKCYRHEHFLGITWTSKNIAGRAGTSFCHFLCPLSSCKHKARGGNLGIFHFVWTPMVWKTLTESPGLPAPTAVQCHLCDTCLSGTLDQSGGCPVQRGVFGAEGDVPFGECQRWALHD